MLSPKVVGFVLLIFGSLAILFHFLFTNKLVLFYGWMLILFGLAAFVRIRANPATMKNKTYFLLGLDSPSAWALAEQLCAVDARIILLKESIATKQGAELKRSFPENVQALSGNNLAEELDQTLQERTLKGVAFLSEKFEAGDVELMPASRVEAMLEENVLKVVRTVKILLPFLRESRGRIVFLGSTTGRLALPAAAHFSLCKFALEGFADGLRRELRRFDMKIVTVERCLHVSTTQDESLGSAMWAEANEDTQETYGSPYMTGVARTLRADTAPNMAAVRTFTEALAAENPKDRYVLCPEEQLLCPNKVETILSQFIPATLMDVWVDIRHGANLPPCKHLPPPHIK